MFPPSASRVLWIATAMLPATLACAHDQVQDVPLVRLCKDIHLIAETIMAARQFHAEEWEAMLLVSESFSFENGSERALFHFNNAAELIEKAYATPLVSSHKERREVTQRFGAEEEARCLATGG